VTTTQDELRPLLFGIAYRMTGSVGDAEDLVQDAYLRFHEADGVRSPRAFLTTIVTRLAIDHLRSARVRRERYVGPWLPEPLATDHAAEDPADRALHAATLSLALLRVLERLDPVDRAAYVLREALELPYAEVATALERSEEACRQLVARARRRLEAEDARYSVTREQHAALTERFVRAATQGDVAALVELLAADAAAYTDGGGKARAASKPINGAEKVARFMATIARPERTAELAGFAPAELNGAPGYVALDAEGRPISTLTLALDADGRIAEVLIVVNPEKLAAVRSPPPPTSPAS
jgi:RNA polymerase sigma-70 factor, ECF subfamily